MIIGIDPGLSGGMAVIEDDGTYVSAEQFGGDSDFAARLRAMNNGDYYAVVEKVHSMPGQGVASSFTFGRNVGFIHGALTALGIPWEAIAPQAWQRTLRVGKRGKDESKNAFKKMLLEAARKMFPQAGGAVTLKTCDALLLAEAYRRIRAGKA